MATISILVSLFNLSVVSLERLMLFLHIGRTVRSDGRENKLDENEQNEMKSNENNTLQLWMVSKSIASHSMILGILSFN